jgi:hypothetical protein
MNPELQKAVDIITRALREGTFGSLEIQYAEGGIVMLREYKTTKFNTRRTGTRNAATSEG